MPLYRWHFAGHSVCLQASVDPNVPQPLRKNKTASLVTLKGAEAYGE